jgi:hypothetical protein
LLTKPSSLNDELLNGGVSAELPVLLQHDVQYDGFRDVQL